MKNVLLPACLLAVLATTALADTALQTDAPAKPSISSAASGTTRIPVAIGVNVPLGWMDGTSIGGSLYVGLTKRLAVRGNVASYVNDGNMFADLAGDEASHSGRITDLGVGVVHYGNKLWDGFTIEAGLLRRATDIRTTDEFADQAILDTDTVTYSARGLVGYSLLIGDHFFVAFALGMSGGHENGSETSAMDTHTAAPRATQSVSRWEASPEGYLRIGGAFEIGGGN